MSAFIFNSVPQLVCEDGGAASLGSMLAERLGTLRTLVVTDRCLMELGLVDEALSSLDEAGMAPAVFEDVSADPPEEDVLSAVAAAKDHGAELIVGFGGGSAMDVAKLIAVLAKGERELSEIYGVDQVKIQ